MSGRQGLTIGRGLYGSVVESLGRGIVGGRYPEGAILPVDGDLALDLAASRTVLREALRVLAAKGLVDARPMRGTTVRARRDWRLLDPDVLRWWVDAKGEATILHDLLEVRAVVEPGAARLAASRATDQDRAVIEAALCTLAECATDVERYIEADLRLHAAILEAAHNVLLEELFGPIAATLRLGLQVQARVAGPRVQLSDSLPAHARMVQAVVRGSEAAAERAMRDLVAEAERDAEQALGVRPAGGIAG